MSKYDFDKYAIPNKWMEESFDKLADLCERLKKEDHEQIIIDTIPQYDGKKGN